MELAGQELNKTIPVANEMEERLDPLTLNIEDKVLSKIIDDRIESEKKYYRDEKNLYERQEKNFEMLIGKQDPKSFKKYQSKYKDNAIWEGESSIKPIALSRMPDLTVNPGTDNPQSMDTAKKLSDVINSSIKRRENRRVLGMAFRHHPVYFIGVIKCRWDKNKGKNGDYVFEAVHPKNVVLDHYATLGDVEKMDFIAESLPVSAKELISMFPDKREAIYAELQITDGDANKESKLSTRLKVWEVWFKWYEEKADPETGETVSEPIECVVWKYKSIIFKKMKNPYWDWEGTSKPMIGGQEVDINQMNDLLMSGQPTEQIKIFRNYFNQPMKPYIFITYDQWGEMPYDETSRIEQVIPLQEDADKRGRQITEMADRARGKHIFSSDSGLKKKDIQDLDINNPDVDLLLKGEDVRKVHDFIQGEQPSQALFADKENSKTSIFNKMGVHDTTRGVVETDTAANAQIAREADYGRIDDLTEDTINAAAEKIAQWSMQMIKLFYTEDHMVSLLGSNGKSVFEKVNGDMVEDGMEVVVSASGTDKAERKRQAQVNATLKMTDPLTYFEDLGMSDPKGRAEKAIMFATDPQGYFTKYILGLESVPQQVQALGQETPPAQISGQIEQPVTPQAQM